MGFFFELTPRRVSLNTALPRVTRINFCIFSDFHSFPRSILVHRFRGEKTARNVDLARARSSRAWSPNGGADEIPDVHSPFRVISRVRAAPCLDGGDGQVRSEIDARRHPRRRGWSAANRGRRSRAAGQGQDHRDGRSIYRDQGGRGGWGDSERSVESVSGAE